MLKSAVGFTRLRLTESHRSDPALFEWYSRMAPCGSRCQLPLATLLEQAREAFPPRGRACYHLCLSQ